MSTDNVPLPGVARGGNPGTAGGSVLPQDLTGVAGCDSFGNQNITMDSRKPAYRACQTAFTMVATPTAVVVIQGSATKTCRITKINMTGAATAAGNMPYIITRRSTNGTPGSAVLTAVTAAKNDTGDIAPTMVVSTVGTANYTTLGTTAGVVAAGRLAMAALTTGSAGVSSEEFGFREKALVLRGTSDYLTIEFSGTAVPSGGVLDFEIIWSEDNS